jgi:D-alanine-D-alanine ligase
MKHNQNSKQTVAVLFGGRSAEHEISILTALQAISALDPLAYEILPIYFHLNGKCYAGKKLLEKAFYRNFMPECVEEVILEASPISKGFRRVLGNTVIAVDLYFLCFHGQYGEDGCIQGVLELKGVSYTGCNVAASAIAMNKQLCKHVLQAEHIPTLPHCLVRKRDAMLDFQAVQQKILSTKGLEQFPLFVKPCHLGSSIGISRVHDVLSLQSALADAFFYDDELLVEPCITNLMEINVSVLDGEPPRASVLEMPVSQTGVLSYEEKYLQGASKTVGSSSRTEGMASLSRVIDPDIDAELKHLITNYALKAFQALGCSGVVRFDFIVDLSTGALYFNELNPIPGSLSFYLWEKSTPPLLYTELINELLQQAVKRRRMKLSLQQTLDFKALK